VVSGNETACGGRANGECDEAADDDDVFCVLADCKLFEDDCCEVPVPSEDARASIGGPPLLRLGDLLPPSVIALASGEM
jgi:hypothetical protein